MIRAYEASKILALEISDADLKAVITIEIIGEYESNRSPNWIKPDVSRD